MGITKKMIDSLFTKKQPPATGSAAESVSAESAREHSRVPFRGRCTAVIFPPDNKLGVEPTESEVLTTDISRGGLSVLHRHELFPNQQLLLMLTQSSRMVEVCWCCEVWPGLYAAGCRFMDASPEGK
jgi:hypothetical protein